MILEKKKTVSTVFVCIIACFSLSVSGMPIGASSAGLRAVSLCSYWCQNSVQFMTNFFR
jgi:hypothetical protein